MNFSSHTLNNLFADAEHWLWLRRKGYPPESDFWNFRRSWPDEREAVISEFRSGEYRLDLQQRITLASGESVALWSSRDALVLKVLTAILHTCLKPQLSPACYHLRGHGGLKGAVRDVMRAYPRARFFFKTDVKSYYASIRHSLLLLRLHDVIHDQVLIGYVWQFLNRCVEWGGLYQDIRIGIPRGASLSPLIGAFFLNDLDILLCDEYVVYVRYMDDILILTSTRHELRRAIRVVNQSLADLQLIKHPDKTLMGRTERGFDFLGYHFSPGGLSLAEATLARFTEHALRLYEQEPLCNREERLVEYIIRWRLWAVAGL